MIIHACWLFVIGTILAFFAMIFMGTAGVVLLTFAIFALFAGLQGYGLRIGRKK